MFREMRRKKQLLPPEECAQLLRKEKRGALAVIGDMGYPYAIPLNFYYDEDEATIYFHCAREGHKLDALRACDKTCFTVWEKGVQEPGDWAFYVRSVVIMGRAELVPVTDETRVMDKLRKLGAKYFPTVKDTEAEITKAANRVQLVALHIEHLTGKRVHEK